MEFFNSKYFKISMGTIMLLLIVWLLKQINFAIDPLFQAFRIFITPIIFAGVFYYIFRPLYRKLGKTKLLNRNIAMLVVVGLLVVVFTGIIFYTTTTVINESSKAFQDFLGWMEGRTFEPLDPSNWDIPFIDNDQVNEKLLEIQQDLFEWINSLTLNIVGVVGSVASVGYQIIMIPIFMIYFLKDDRKIISDFIHLFPKRYERKVYAYLKEADQSVSSYITGQMLVAIVIGVLMFVGYSIIGMPTKVFLAIFAMVTSIIPFVGPALGIIPALFIALTTDIWLVVKVLIVMILTQQIEGGLIRPKIMSSRLPIHPLTVIIIVIGITSLFGLLGGLIAVPAYILVKLMITSFFNYKERIDAKDEKAE
jgi:predicted PurR-regulated permease PerM